MANNEQAQPQSTTQMPIATTTTTPPPVTPDIDYGGVSQEVGRAITVDKTGGTYNINVMGSCPEVTTWRAEVIGSVANYTTLSDGDKISEKGKQLDNATSFSIKKNGIGSKPGNLIISGYSKGESKSCITSDEPVRIINFPIELKGYKATPYMGFSMKHVNFSGSSVTSSDTSDAVAKVSGLRVRIVDSVWYEENWKTARTPGETERYYIIISVPEGVNYTSSVTSDVNFIRYEKSTNSMFVLNNNGPSVRSGNIKVSVSTQEDSVYEASTSYCEFGVVQKAKTVLSFSTQELTDPFGPEGGTFFINVEKGRSNATISAQTSFYPLYINPTEPLLSAALGSTAAVAVRNNFKTITATIYPKNISQDNIKFLIKNNRDPYPKFENSGFSVDTIVPTGDSILTIITQQQNTSSSKTIVESLYFNLSGITMRFPITQDTTYVPSTPPPNVSDRSLPKFTNDDITLGGSNDRPSPAPPTEPPTPTWDNFCTASTVKNGRYAIQVGQNTGNTSRFCCLDMKASGVTAENSMYESATSSFYAFINQKGITQPIFPVTPDVSPSPGGGDVPVEDPVTAYTYVTKQAIIGVAAPGPILEINNKSFVNNGEDKSGLTFNYIIRGEEPSPAPPMKVTISTDDDSWITVGDKASHSKTLTGASSINVYFAKINSNVGRSGSVSIKAFKDSVTVTSAPVVDTGNTAITRITATTYTYVPGYDSVTINQPKPTVNVPTISLDYKNTDTGSCGGISYQGTNGDSVVISIEQSTPPNIYVPFTLSVPENSFARLQKPNSVGSTDYVWSFKTGITAGKSDSYMLLATENLSFDENKSIVTARTAFNSGEPESSTTAEMLQCGAPNSEVPFSVWIRRDNRFSVSSESTPCPFEGDSVSFYWKDGSTDYKFSNIGLCDSNNFTNYSQVSSAITGINQPSDNTKSKIKITVDGGSGGNKYCRLTKYRKYTNTQEVLYTGSLSQINNKSYDITYNYLSNFDSKDAFARDSLLFTFYNYNPNPVTVDISPEVVDYVLKYRVTCFNNTKYVALVLEDDGVHYSNVTMYDEVRTGNLTMNIYYSKDETEPNNKFIETVSSMCDKLPLYSGNVQFSSPTYTSIVSDDIYMSDIGYCYSSVDVSEFDITGFKFVVDSEGGDAPEHTTIYLKLNESNGLWEKKDRWE